MTRGLRVGLCAAVSALSVSACEAPKPHTYIPAFSPKELAAFGVVAPTSIVSDGRQLTRPPGGPLRTGEEKAMQAGAAAQRGVQEPGRRALGFRPDRVTELEGTLGYFEVFTPAVAPFKRVSALDAVVLDGATPVLTVADPARRVLPIEGLESEPPDARVRDRFWGSVVLDFAEGSMVPLPSVSPESRLLHVETEPATPLTFERDGADNFYAVASDGSRSPGQVRVTYVIDAPRDYFGAALPTGPVDVLAAEVPALPDKVQRDALSFARELGLSRSTDSARALTKLVEHFRSFEESRLAPEDTGNILLDLARGKRGVCRHRAYAFVIVAQALGIPARFVQNEAHAWVEVKLPQLSYMRIDLGGAAAGLNPHALEDKPFYRPQVEDPWPRPRVYQESYARAAQALQTGSATTQRGNAGARGRNETALKPTLSRAQSRASLESQIPDERVPVLLSVSRYLPEVLRGTSFEVEGSARQRSGLPVAGLRVEVSLSSTESERAVLLGVSVTDEQGLFRGTFTVPPSIDPADYALVVVTPGDARHAAARAD